MIKFDRLPGRTFTNKVDERYQSEDLTKPFNR